MTTFDGASNANYTLSGASLIATDTTSQATWQTIRTTTSKTAGKLHLEMVCNQPHNTGGSQYDSWGFGFINGSGSLNDFPGHMDANGIMADCGNAANDIWYNSTKNTGFAGSPSFQPGDVLAAEIDIPNAVCWFRDITRDAGTPHWWGANNNGTDDPTNHTTGFAIATLVGSAVYACLATSYNASPQMQGTLRTTLASFSGTPSTGYSPWDIVTLIPSIDTRRNRTYLRR